MQNCPYCGSSAIIYVGVEDGGGDYGDSVCDTWFCTACESNFEDGCYGGGDPDGDELPDGDASAQLPTAVYFDPEFDDDIPF